MYQLYYPFTPEELAQHNIPINDETTPGLRCYTNYMEILLCGKRNYSVGCIRKGKNQEYITRRFGPSYNYKYHTTLAEAIKVLYEDCEVTIKPAEPIQPSNQWLIDLILRIAAE